MGLEDMYINVGNKPALPGWENNIMATSSEHPGKPSALDILLIILSHNNACPCEP
jgi:hypothetical protein